MVQYFSIKVPKVLAEQITKVAIEKGSYRTVSEFVLESARRHLEQMDK
jgi:Arc/MetJ-type ribon-helix-helix transcriptional regulator